MRSAVRTRRVLARCRKSRRAWRTFRWARATLSFAFSRLAEPPVAAGHPPLVAGQGAGLALQVPWVGDLVSVAGGSEVSHAEVDADGVPGLRQGFRGVGVDGEGDVPAAVALAANDHHRRVKRSHVHARPGPHVPQRVLVLASRSSPSRKVNALRV
jgi:hypothetical protein